VTEAAEVQLCTLNQQADRRLALSARAATAADVATGRVKRKEKQRRKKKRNKKKKRSKKFRRGLSWARQQQQQQRDAATMREGNSGLQIWSWVGFPREGKEERARKIQRNIVIAEAIKETKQKRPTICTCQRSRPNAMG
jgi:flagellar basal body L-ring protein FlgH